MLDAAEQKMCVDGKALYELWSTVATLEHKLECLNKSCVDKCNTELEEAENQIEALGHEVVKLTMCTVRSTVLNGELTQSPSAYMSVPGLLLTFKEDKALLQYSQLHSHLLLFAQGLVELGSHLFDVFACLVFFFLALCVMSHTCLTISAQYISPS
jgi:hypothetical protein